RPFEELDVDAGLAVAVELADDLRELDVVDVDEGQTGFVLLGSHGRIVSPELERVLAGCESTAMEIAGKVAVVTGAASGSGRATAVALAREGASVVVADLDEAGGQETVGLIADEGGTAIFVRCDVSEARSIEALFARAVEEFGGLDIVHNNAGMVCG